MHSNRSADSNISFSPLNPVAERTLIYSNWGTLIYLDPVSRALKHGPGDAVPQNLFFLSSGERQISQKGTLAFIQNGAPKAVVLDDQGKILALSELPEYRPLNASLLHLERGIVSIVCNDRFISCASDGTVTLSKLCSWWEFLHLSEDWRPQFDIADAGLPQALAANIDWSMVKSYIVHPQVRTKTLKNTNAKKVLFYGYPKWSHGRVYYDLCKALYQKGYVVDLLDWQADHPYIMDLIDYYDLFITACEGVPRLLDVFRVPPEMVIAVAHHEFDVKMLADQKGGDIFHKLNNYGVVSEFVYCTSLMRGISRVPIVTSLGVFYDDFYSEIPSELRCVGYASSYSVTTFGVEWKRGYLAEAAARTAGLDFKIAGSTGNQTSFHDMPKFYRTVDAIVNSSLSEAAQLPVMEGAAAGRLIIGTPVGHFPRRAYQGGGILAPVEARKFESFVSETLKFYKENPSAFVDKCHSIQESARAFDWRYSIQDWIDLIETES